jgi:hypothetical protein
MQDTSRTAGTNGVVEWRADLNDDEMWAVSGLSASIELRAQRRTTVRWITVRWATAIPMVEARVEGRSEVKLTLQVRVTVGMISKTISTVWFFVVLVFMDVLYDTSRVTAR